MRVRRSIFTAFVFWPTALGMLLSGLVMMAFGEENAARLTSLIFIIGGFWCNTRWEQYIDRSGMTDRVHDALGLTMNPYTGRYGATREEIQADAKRVQDLSDTPKPD